MLGAGESSWRASARTRLTFGIPLAGPPRQSVAVDAARVAVLYSLRSSPSNPALRPPYGAQRRQTPSSAEWPATSGRQKTFAPSPRTTELDLSG